MPVYIITYKQFIGSSVERFQKRISRFATLDDTVEYAQMNYGINGRELLNVRLETSGELFLYKVGRVLVRSARVGAGIVLAVVSYSLVIETGPAVGDIPISKLTLGMIASALIRGAVLIGLWAASWTLAFGEGPRDMDA